MTNEQASTFIGLDVHNATISVAVAQGTRGGEVRHWGSVPHRPDHIRKLVEKLTAGGVRLHFCYEAGPCGYGLHRQLVEMGHRLNLSGESLIRRGAVTKNLDQTAPNRPHENVGQTAYDGVKRVSTIARNQCLHFAKCAGFRRLRWRIIRK